MLKKEYLIGDVVSWKVGNVFAKGLVRDEFENEFEIVCFEVNGSPTRKKLKINKECIIEE